MTHDQNRETVERYWDALQRGDFDAAMNDLHEDFVESYPQSGERVVGKDNYLALIRNHPTFPGIAVRRHVGRDDLWVTEVGLDYAKDGSPAWESCEIQEFKDGRISRITALFGAPFEAAEWRSQWVERS